MSSLDSSDERELYKLLNMYTPNFTVNDIVEYKDSNNKDFYHVRVQLILENGYQFAGTVVKSTYKSKNHALGDYCTTYQSAMFNKVEDSKKYNGSDNLLDLLDKLETKLNNHD